jgi:hypothetical protein
MTSPIYGLPELTPTTVERTNTNLVVRYLEALVGAVPTVNVSVVPTSPTDGSVYLINGVPTGIWAGKAGQVGIYTISGWFYVPTHPKYLYASGSWSSSGGGPVVGGTARVRMSADRTYYVRATGMRTGNLATETDATTNVDSDAFGSISAALSALAKLDGNGFSATLLVNAGTWTTNLIVPQMLGMNLLTISGAGVASTFFNGSLTFVSPGLYKIENFKISNSSGVGIVVDNGDVTIGNLDYGTCSNVHHQVTLNGILRLSQDYTISGGAAAHFAAYDLGKIVANPVAPRTVTLTGSPAFLTAFAIAQRQGAILAVSQTYTGSATGPRVNISQGGSCIVVGGAGSGSTSYFPGNMVGTVDASSYGIYA